jgi:invasion protein IalB
MNLRTTTAPARIALGFGAAVATMGVFAADIVSAQQTPPGAPAQQRPAQRPAQPAQRPAQPAQRPAQPPAQAQQPAQPQQQAPGQQAGQAAETPPLVFTAWYKRCGPDQPQAGQKKICFTIKEARLDSGQFVASAGLIEAEGEQNRILRVTLPLGLLLQQGTRMVVDTNEPMMGAYSFCLPNGCWADFQVTPDFVARLKKGQNLTLQAFNLNAQVANFSFPLADFAKVNEGAPMDDKAIEEQQKKLQEEMQKKAEEIRKQQGGQPGQPGQPPRSQ